MWWIRRRRRTRLVQNHPYYRLDERPMKVFHFYMGKQRIRFIGRCFFVTIASKAPWAMSF